MMNSSYFFFYKMSPNSSLAGASGGGPKTPDISHRERSPPRKATDPEKKIGHRRVGEGGVTFKKVVDFFV